MDLNTIFINRLANTEGVAGTASDARSKRITYSGSSFVDFFGSAKTENVSVNTRAESADNKDRQKIENKQTNGKVKGGDSKTGTSEKAKRTETKMNTDRAVKRDDTVKEAEGNQSSSNNITTEAEGSSVIEDNIKADETIEDTLIDTDAPEDHIISLLNMMIASNSEITDKLSEILDIPAEQIENVLNELNMSALDLLDKSNMTGFMQKVMNVQDTVQLLSIPDITKVYDDVNSLLSGYSEQVDTIKNLNLNELASTDLQASATADTTQSNDTKSMVQQLESDINVDDSVKDIVSAKTTNGSNAEDSTAVKNTDQITVQNTSDKASGAPPATIKNIFNILQAKVTGLKENFVQPEQIANIADAIMLTEQQVEQPVEVNVALNDDHGSELFGQNSGFDNETQIVSQNNTSQSNEISSFAEKVKNESTRNINQADVVNQIIEKLKVEIRGNITEMKLTLKPEHLGDVTLKVQTQNGIVTAQFLAENQRVKEIIESNFNQLRDILQEQGVKISQLTVSIGGQETQERNSGEGYQPRGSSRTVGTIQTAAADEEPVNDIVSKIANSRVDYSI